ncbi:winged helix-turn-helix transcriptional regulator [Sneathiella aquimaris]|uniref:winged helix-turn-helix transcriptional regulator n=1 Tax=Sneathiella aquimaris TaxID=2599305 RepID=UPI00146ED6A8|nr:helix-turn-helix domain-containing protein [Sneathiella aquimaris]
MALKVRKNKSPSLPNNCPLTECMAVIGGAWTPNILWALKGGARRFSELRLDIPHVSAKMLTTRLRELEDRFIIFREVKPTSPPSVEYSLTGFGKELMPAIEAIANVGHKIKLKRDSLENQSDKIAS